MRGTLRVTRLAGVPGEIAPAAWDEIDASIRETALATVRAIRPRLAAGPAALDERDLAVAGCLLVAESHSAPNSSANCATTASRS